jgi:hypothetical protein
MCAFLRLFRGPGVTAPSPASDGLESTHGAGAATPAERIVPHDGRPERTEQDDPWRVRVLPLMF